MKSKSLIIPVVLDESLVDSNSWTGLVGEVLKDSVPVDFTTNNLENNVNDLYDIIIKIIDEPIMKKIEKIPLASTDVAVVNESKESEEDVDSKVPVIENEEPSELYVWLTHHINGISEKDAKKYLKYFMIQNITTIEQIATFIVIPENELVLKEFNELDFNELLTVCSSLNLLDETAIESLQKNFIEISNQTNEIINNNEKWNDITNWFIKNIPDITNENANLYAQKFYEKKAISIQKIANLLRTHEGHLIAFEMQQGDLENFLKICVSMKLLHEVTVHDILHRRVDFWK